MLDKMFCWCILQNIVEFKRGIHMTTKMPGNKKGFEKGVQNLKAKKEDSVIVKMLRERGIDTNDL